MPLLVAFASGASGPWRIESIEAVSGEPLPSAAGWQFWKERPFADYQAILDKVMDEYRSN